MKKYTIEDLAQGKCACINDSDNIEHIFRVMKTAFPNDTDSEYDEDNKERMTSANDLEFYAVDEFKDNWFPYNETELPKQSVIEFYKQIDLTPLKGELILTEEIYQNKPTFKGGMNLDSEPSIGAEFEPIYAKSMRHFSTGATRNLSDDKLDFEGFLSPLALEEFAKYMHKNRIQADGKMRDSDNWQKGIPTDAYMSSMWRHFFDTWKSHRGLETPEDQISNLCGLLFNVQGMLHELLKTK